MDRTGIWISWLFAAHIATSMVLAEIWRGKRAHRLKVRRGDYAKLSGWLHAAPTKSHRRRPAWKTARARMSSTAKPN